MPQFFRKVSHLFRAQVQRHRNRPFLRAVMAACALVAMANGAVSFRQRVRVDRVIETLDALKVFDPHEGVELFNEFVEVLRTDPEAGHRVVLDVVAKEVSQDPEKARLLARICLTVSEQGGRVPSAERREIAALCRSVGLDSDDCDLGLVERPPATESND